MATTKRKRVSKKTKKSWRKNVDINDVEEFLDEKRFEQRTGFIAAEVPDDELFDYHTQGDNEDKTTPVQPIQTKRISSTYRLKEQKLPKSFEILEKRSAVKDPLIKRNRVKTREEKRHPAVKKIFEKRLESGILTSKEKASLRDRKKAKQLRSSESKIPEFKYDLWSKENIKELDKYSDWLREDTVRHNLKNTGHQIKKPPKSILTKTSLLPAIEEPHPGISYNPSVAAQTELLHIVAEVEKNMVKEEKHIKRVTTDMFSKVKQGEAEKEWMREMLAGIVPTKDDDDDDEEITGDYTTVNPPVKNKKKTLQKRRRLREASQLKAKLRQKKIEKKKISDIYKLRKFNSEIKKQETQYKLEKAKREEQKKLKPFQTKTLSHTKFIEPLLDYNPTEEIPGNLRGVKAHVNLLRDRFKSLQKRNILEPTVKHVTKKGKRKKYERQCTKMEWEQNNVANLLL